MPAYTKYPKIIKIRKCLECNKEFPSMTDGWNWNDGWDIRRCMECHILHGGRIDDLLIGVGFDDYDSLLKKLKLPRVTLYKWWMIEEINEEKRMNS